MAISKDLLLAKVRSGENLTFREQLSLVSVLSIPAMMAHLSMVLMQSIDLAMVGHLGKNQAASVGLVTTCTWLFAGFCMALVTGFSVQVAHLVGAGHYKSGRKVVGQGLVAALGFSVLMGAIGFFISKPLPYWLGSTDPVINQDASTYFSILAIFLPGIQISWMVTMVLQASGNMKIPSILNGLMCVMDIGFNYLFIYVLDLGVKGAALGTGIAEVITAVLMLYFLMFRSKELGIRRNERYLSIPHGKCLQTAISISLPLYLQNIVMRGAYVASTIIVAPLGPIALAANQFAVTAEGFCYMPGYGVGDAATTLVGQSLGAGRRKLAKRFAWISTASGMVVMTILSILMFIAAPWLMSIMTTNQEVIELGTYVLRIEAFAETFYAAALVAEGACMGAGDTLIPSFISLSCMWLIRIIPSIFLVKAMGLAGFWLAMAVELNIRGLIFLFRIKGNRWMKRKIVTNTVVVSPLPEEGF